MEQILQIVKYITKTGNEQLKTPSKTHNHEANILLTCLTKILTTSSFPT